MINFKQISYRKYSTFLQNEKKVKQILNFWFTENYDRHSTLPPALLRKWFNPTQAIDDQIKQHFFQDLHNLKSGQYNDWENHRDGKLASVILADQFSRNIFRRQKDAFEYDEISLRICRQILKQDKIYNQYKNFEKVFILLPFEHSENLDDQQTCYYNLKLLADNIVKDGYYDAEVAMNMMIKYSYQHLKVIEEFGRFPHRNEVLGRQSTPNELEYLKDGQRYGQ
ncbi:membrane protein [Stylonychia lemnae]|uniref:Membrane protein n=1 Tax=Stylonychia lemnae TaxID=5949 RepID=A0A078B172_STYLE|nr:membrane protein [Stylonychia lemnae]|eukprot:CDW86868.1 membrane protein [Stylonychia lemnae]